MVAECKAEDSEETLEAAGRRGDGERRRRGEEDRGQKTEDNCEFEGLTIVD